LIRHLHQFATETRLTSEEWLAHRRPAAGLGETDGKLLLGATVGQQQAEVPSPERCAAASASG